MGLLRTIRSAASLLPFWFKAAPNADFSELEPLLAMAYGCQGIHPMQVESEFLEFARIVRQQRPNAFLEIGTRNGGTFFVLCRLAAPQAVVISLDLPGGRYGGGYTPFQIPILRRMKQSKQEIYLLRTDSHKTEAKVRVDSALRGKPLDLLFIDGDHTYDGVRKDFETYAPLVRPGGIVAFHDIVEISEPDFGVRLFWNEVKGKFRSQEIVENPNQGWGGIGVLYP